MLGNMAAKTVFLITLGSFQRGLAQGKSEQVPHRPWQHHVPLYCPTLGQQGLGLHTPLTNISHARAQLADCVQEEEPWLGRLLT